MNRSLALTGLGLSAFLIPWLAFVADRGIAWVAGAAAILSLPWLLTHRGAVANALSQRAVRLGLGGLVAVMVLGLLSPLWSALPDQAARMQELAIRSAIAIVTGIPLVLLALTIPGARRLVIRGISAGIAVGIAIALFDLFSDHLLLRIRTVFSRNLDTPDGLLTTALTLTPDLFMARFNDFWVVMTLAVASLMTVLRPGWMFPLALMLILAFSFMTISETSQLIGVIGILVYAFCHLARQSGVLVMLVLTAGFTLLSPLAFPAINSVLLASIDGSNLLEYKLLERFEIWAAVVDTVRDHPILGHGLEFERLNATYTGPGDYYRLDHLWHPHSIFAQVWQDIGLLGALAMVMMITALHLGALRLPNRQRAAATALIAMGLGAFGAAHSIWLGWWICMFILVATLVITCVRHGHPEKRA
ncbi:MAG: O-antigen ligase family protein [Minwuia sp.]|nr:O-antigen ligase family protein [Minwuia sp.]